jgi:predicted HAD superfamily Cof-like phosphohydrolase
MCDICKKQGLDRKAVLVFEFPGENVATCSEHAGKLMKKPVEYEGTLAMVAEFSHKFGYPVNEKPAMPSNRALEEHEALIECADALSGSTDRIRAAAEACGGILCLRLRLIIEELEELADSMVAANETEALDALCDLRYVLDGTTHLLGMGAVFPEAMRRVHSSNMSKAGPDGKPIHDAAGKLMKGPNYAPPDLTDLVGDEPE